MYCTANIKHRAFAQEDNPRIVAELRKVFLNQVRPEEGILHSREYNQTPRIADKAVYADYAPTGTLVFFFRLDNDTTQLHVELKERETKYFYELRRVIGKTVEAFKIDCNHGIAGCALRSPVYTMSNSCQRETPRNYS